MSTNANYEWSREPEPENFAKRVVATWRARALVIFFARIALYKTIRRTILGWLWLPLRGLVPTLVGSLVIGGFLGVSAAGAPYPLILLSGLIPWVAFASTAMWAVRCLELTRRYTRAVAFPRLVLPLGFSAPAIVDMAMFAVTYLLVFLWYRLNTDLSIPWPEPHALLYLLLAWLAGLGVGLILCIPGAQVRDIRFSLSYALSMALALSPVAYPASLVPEKWAFLMSVNPLAGIVEGFRSAVLGQPGPLFSNVAFAVIFTVMVFCGGFYVFNRFQDKLTERV